MTSLLAGLAVVLGVVSLAVQGTESPLYELWQTFDGVEVASASEIDVTQAWGPHYRIYVTGTTTITELNGGHQGQV